MVIGMNRRHEEEEEDHHHDDQPMARNAAALTGTVPPWAMSGTICGGEQATTGLRGMSSTTCHRPGRSGKRSWMLSKLS